MILLLSPSAVTAAERFDVERLRLCVKLMIGESVSQYDNVIVLGTSVSPCEV